jgi:hypothetical protein
VHYVHQLFFIGKLEIINRNVRTSGVIDAKYCCLMEEKPACGCFIRELLLNEMENEN